MARLSLAEYVERLESALEKLAAFNTRYNGQFHEISTSLEKLLTQMEIQRSPKQESSPADADVRRLGTRFHELEIDLCDRNEHPARHKKEDTSRGLAKSRGQGGSSSKVKVYLNPSR